MLRRSLACWMLALTAAGLGACGGGKDGERSSFDDSLRGGTLRVGVIRDGVAPLDPSIGPSFLTSELYRCCLLRTLLSYPGASTSDGGSVLHPDLASGDPVLSPNGRVWTFHLKPGIRYAPPYADRTVRSQDVVRAIQRSLRLPDAWINVYFDVIAGASDYAAHRSDSVSGLETPNSRTLVVRLSKPVGDLANRIALTAAAPIPPGAVGKDGELRALPATGPYRIKRFDPGRRLELVRNSSWDSATDPLRPAYPNRISISVVPKIADLVTRLDGGRIDVPLFASWIPQAGAPPSAVRRYVASPQLRRRVHGGSGSSLWAVSMNVAIPPFDDVHVRRAANLAIDRSALLRTDPLSSGRPATHIIPDALENGLLDGYDPYPARNGSPDIRRARAEMAKSRYDRDRDGVCDSRVCDSLLAATRVEPIYRRQAAIVAEGLKRLGIHLHWRAFDVEGFFEKTTLQRGKYAVALPITWLADYPSASGVLNPLFFGPEFQTLGNPSLVGAPDRVLREAGYRRRRTPDIDSTISLCNREIGAEAFSCWAQADMLLMQRVVPWVPYNFPRNIELVGPRVRRFSWDQSSGGPLPAFERIVLR